MDAIDFERTIVVEQLVAVGKLDDFFDAVDADDVKRAVALLRKARVDEPTIAIVVEKMRAADGAH